MALFEELREVRIYGGLSGEGAGHLCRVHRLLEHHGVATLVPLETRYKQPLIVYEGVQHLLGFRPFLDLEILPLHTPAERAQMGALVEGRGHLQAAVGLDPVEILFIACALMEKALFHPPAQLHCGMVAVDPIVLAYESLPVFLIHCYHLRNRKDFSGSSSEVQALSSPMRRPPSPTPCRP